MSNPFECNGELGFITSRGLNPCFENYIILPLLTIVSTIYVLYHWKPISFDKIKSEKLFNVSSSILFISLVFSSIQIPNQFFLIVTYSSLYLLHFLIRKTYFYIILSSLFCIICCFHQHTSSSVIRLSTSLLSAVNLLFILFSSENELLPTENLPPPTYEINFVNKWTYSYLTPLLALAQSRLLGSSDLPQLPREKPQLNEKLKTNTFIKSLLIVFIPKILVILPYFFVMSSLKYVLPYVQRQILLNLEQNKSIFWLSLVMLLAPLISAFVRQRHNYLSSLIHIQMKKEITDIIFNKLLITQRVNSSKIVNLINIDVEKIVRVVVHVLDLLDLPLSIIICSFMLYGLVGIAALYGLIGMALCFPITIIIIKYQRKMRFELMQLRDHRGKITTELLTNVRGVKLEGLVEIAQQRVEKCRLNEQNLIRKLSIIDGSIFGITRLLPAIISMITFSVFIRNGELTGSIAFPTLSIFQILQHPLSFLPMLLMGLTEAKVSTERMEKFLSKSEYEGIKQIDDDKFAIQLKGSFGYKETMVLNNLDIDIEKGKLVMVIGQVGSGKTTLLNAILGECSHTSEIFNGVNGKIGFISATPWLRNASVLDNIIMGKEYDEERLNRVIQICQLKPDIEIFHDGIQTQIGERGITLSGGQKQRIALARSVYNSSDVYLMDDVLSAVDAHVSIKIFEEVINGDLKGTTRILCTHQLQYLPQADQIIVLENNSIAFNGTYEHFTQTNFMRTLDEMKQITQPSPTITPIPIKKEVKKSVKEIGQEVTPQPQQSPDELMTKENMETGIVKNSVIWEYIDGIGGIGGILLYLLVSFSVKGSMTLSDYMLTFNPIPLFYYFILQLIGVAFTLIKNIVEARLGTKATTSMHNSMFYHVLHSPFIFFDTTPMGRILNRFTKDIETMDGQLKRVLSMCIMQAITVLAVLLLNLFSSILFMPLLILLSYVYIQIIVFYIDSSQNLQRLQSTTKSPVLSIVTETIPGLYTIRAERLSQLLFDQQSSMFDNHQRSNYSNQLVDRWLCLRVDSVGAFVMFGSVIAASFGGASVAGLAISYAMNATHSLVFLIKTFSEVQSSFVSVERVLEYCKLETEDEINQKELDTSIDFKPIPTEGNGVEQPNDIEMDRNGINAEALIKTGDWPIGDIEFKNVTMRYRKELPEVLKNISFSIKHGEKIGVCGRTGSGKSSILQVLFKTVSNVSGTITIDGVSLKQFPHDLLRQTIGIIPQDPLVFQGTLRENIDPFNRKTDQEIIDILKEMGFDKEFKSLNDKIEENGKNLSTGSRQLLCIARECLRESKIIALDEATAGIDFETDQCIQKSIRKLMENKTVLTIAHRIHTIIDYDRVIVMDNGTVKEFDSPQNLLQNPTSLFYSFVNQRPEEN